MKNVGSSKLDSRRIAIGLIGSFVGFGVSAHHSSAPYFDHARVIEVEGKITEVLWQNPHVRFWPKAAVRPLG